MIDDKTGKPVDGSISPYLQQPLRTLEKARQDSRDQQRESAEAKTKQPN